MAHFTFGPMCYYVYQADGGWTVAFDHECSYFIHTDKAHALAAARDAAEAVWLITKQTSCVRIGSPEGESLLDRTYGI